MPSKPNSPSPRTERTVAVISAIVVALLCSCGISVWPTWEIVPFLTSDYSQIIPIFYIAMVSVVLFQILTAIRPSPRVSTVGKVVNNLIGLVASVVMWLVFPFTFAGSGWGTLFRVLIAIGFALLLLAACMNLVVLVRGPEKTTQNMNATQIRAKPSAQQAPAGTRPAARLSPPSTLDPLPQPGWYADPYEEARLRWWEGDRWSDRVSH